MKTPGRRLALIALLTLPVLAAGCRQEPTRWDEAEQRTKNKPAVTSLREIAAGKVHFNRNSQEVVNEWVKQQQALAINR